MRVALSAAALADVREYAARAYPREACGVLVVARGRQRYVPCRNLSSGVDQFAIDPADWVMAEEAGEVLAVVHSHPDLPPTPSDADRAGCEQTRLPWIIVSHPSGAMAQIEPSGWRPPLVGRQFSHGALDCYTLIRDYYTEVLGIRLPDFAREDEWWCQGRNLYLDHFPEAGFARVPDAPRPHDVLLMQVASRVPNHGAVYLGDGMILHHQMGRLSSRDVYGGWYRKVTTHVLRHRSLM